MNSQVGSDTNLLGIPTSSTARDIKIRKVPYTYTYADSYYSEFRFFHSDYWISNMIKTKGYFREIDGYRPFLEKSYFDNDIRNYMLTKNRQINKIWFESYIRFSYWEMDLFVFFSWFLLGLVIIPNLLLMETVRRFLYNW